MRSLRKHLEVQLDTPWLLASRREIIADELFLHLEDHRICLEEEGLPKDAAWAEAWAAFGDLKAAAGEFLAQHRLEAYAFYSLYVLLFAAVLWPLPSVINFLFTGNGETLMNQLTGPQLGNRLLVTWELFWLFVLVRTAHCTARGPVRRWTIIGLLFPGYLILGVLTPFILTFLFQSSLEAPWLAWFNPDWMQGWLGILQASGPGWLVSTASGRESFIVANIIGIYIIRAYAIEGCWQGRDWPRLLLMTILLILGASMFLVGPRVEELTQMTRSVAAWSNPQMASQQGLAFLLLMFKHLLLVGYFIGGLRAMDAAYGAVVRHRSRSRHTPSEAMA